MCDVIRLKISCLTDFFSLSHLKVFLTRMYVKFRIYILLFEIISLSFATTSKANRLLENLCETLNDNDGIQLDEDKQWEVICRELLNDKQDSRDVNNGRN